MFSILKKKKYIISSFQNITQSVRKQIPNREGWHYIAVKQLS